jgi:hypothetical protein
MFTAQAVQNMVRLLFVPKDNLHVFKSTIIHGKPYLGNLNGIGCEATHQVVQTGTNKTQMTIDRNIVQFLVVSGGKHAEVINYDWECEKYSAILGSCDNITTDIDYATQQHLRVYSNEFCAMHSFNADDCQLISNTAIANWKQNIAIKVQAMD